MVSYNDIAAAYGMACRSVRCIQCVRLARYGEGHEPMRPQNPHAHVCLLPGGPKMDDRYNYEFVDIGS